MTIFFILCKGGGEPGYETLPERTSGRPALDDHLRQADILILRTGGGGEGEGEGEGGGGGGGVEGGGGLIDTAGVCMLCTKIINLESSVADPGCLTRIRVFSIPDPRSA
jgi:hypothetical protein